MNKLDPNIRSQIVACLVEGNSIASTCRLCHVNKRTVLRIVEDLGTVCAEYHDLAVRNLSCKRVQVDEQWSYVHTKNGNVKMKDCCKGYGDAWIWIAIDADNKLIIAWTVGGRDSTFARDFIDDMADRINGRIQLTSDGHVPYLDAVSRTYGDDVDFAQLVKIYAGNKNAGPERRYSPAEVVDAKPKIISGNPDPMHISTSYSERANLTNRMTNRRLTRLTNAFSKKMANHRHMLAIQFVHYNFCRKHMTLGTTPAIAAGITKKHWTTADMIALLESEEARCGGGRIKKNS